MAGNIRQKLKDYMVPVSVVCAMIAITALITAVSQFSDDVETVDPGRVVYAWFFDLGDRKLFKADSRLVPPIEAPSGGTAVSAVVFGCGGCNDESKWRVAYIEKYTAEGKAGLERHHHALAGSPNDDDLHKQTMSLRQHGLLRSDPDQIDWQLASSAKGMALIRAAPCHGGAPARRCQAGAP